MSTILPFRKKMKYSGILYRCIIDIQIQQVQVAHRWWWWHIVHQTVQLMLIEDGGYPSQEQEVGSTLTCARSLIREDPRR
jgi:hypothetical protein